MIVIEHSPELMICADWIIDLGPGAGDEGGRIVAQGTPEEVARSGTLTGAVIARPSGQGMGRDLPTSPVFPCEITDMIT